MRVRITSIASGGALRPGYLQKPGSHGGLWYRVLVAVFGFVLILTHSAKAETTTLETRCWRSEAAAAVEEASQQRYAPGREVVIDHLALDITPDFRRRTIEGQATLRLKVNAGPVKEIGLDAVDLAVRKVESSVKLAAYEVEKEKIVLTFVEPLRTGSDLTVTVDYSAEPDQGLYFRTPEMGYKAGDDHLFTQGESIEARHWFPCLDAPNQMFTSEVTCRVPEGMTAISNGHRVDGATGAGSGLQVFHWLQDKPHATYLMTLTAGYFKGIEAKCGDIPLGFFTPASEILQASNSFRNTDRMMMFFEEFTGTKYPWDKYYQVCVNDFVAGGMENTSATTLTDRTLFTEATENLRDSEGLVAHELAHQWFGDLVTCKDWSHIWLNEGFATYFETLWVEHSEGRDQMNYELYQRARQLTASPGEGTPIVRRSFDRPGDMFDHLAYGKGSWVLHMLRAQVGDEVFKRGVRTYLDRRRHNNVVTDDLRAVMEELSGQSLDRFFDQWLYHGGCPELQVDYSWDEATRLAKISVKQTQPVSDKVLLFDFPLEVRFKGKSPVSDQRVAVRAKEEDFYFALPSAPTSVRIDPENVLLAKINFNPSRAMLDAQLNDEVDLPGRLLAIQQLSGRKDREAVEKLKSVLNRDKFHGVRREAARTLGKIHSPEALDALLASVKQGDPRVRQTVLDAIGDFYDPRAFAAVRAAVPGEKNPAIVATLLKASSIYPKPEVRTTLLEYLNTVSYRDELAEAAMEGMRTQDDPFFTGLLLETLTRREPEFGTSALVRGVQTLAFLARNETDKDQVRDYLLKHVNDPRRRVRLASLGALGTLGDERSIPVLQTFAAQSGDNPEQKAATSALAEVRQKRRSAPELDSLRKEVLELQKANRDLRREVDDLTRKVSAKPEMTPPPPVRGKRK